VQLKRRLQPTAGKPLQVSGQIIVRDDHQVFAPVCHDGFPHVDCICAKAIGCRDGTDTAA
jgi:hypothetical protein